MRDKSRRPVFKKFRVRDLRIDPAAQRELRRARVKWIVDNFRWDGIGVPYVSERLDGVFVINGQHRREALMELGHGDEWIWCEVAPHSDKANDASLFLMRNDALPVRALDRFRVRFTANEAAAVEIVQILSEFGLKVGDSDGEGVVRSPAALDAVYAKGPDVLRGTIDTIVEVFGKDRASAFDGNIIQGIGRVLAKHRDIPWTEFARKLRGHSGNAAGLLGDARAVKALHGGSIADAVAGLVVAAYNKSRRSGGIPEWRRG